MLCWSPTRKHELTTTRHLLQTLLCCHTTKTTLSPSSVERYRFGGSGWPTPAPFLSSTPRNQQPRRSHRCSHPHSIFFAQPANCRHFDASKHLNSLPFDQRAQRVNGRKDRNLILSPQFWLALCVSRAALIRHAVCSFSQRWVWAGGWFGGVTRFRLAVFR